MLSQPTHMFLFLAMLSSTSRHETPLLSGHGRDVPRGAVCENCFHTRAVVIWASLHCAVHGAHEFQAKVFRNVSLEFVKNDNSQH